MLFSPEEQLHDGFVATEASAHRSSLSIASSVLKNLALWDSSTFSPKHICRLNSPHSLQVLTFKLFLFLLRPKWITFYLALEGHEKQLLTILFVRTFTMFKLAVGFLFSIPNQLVLSVLPFVSQCILLSLTSGALTDP